VNRLLSHGVFATDFNGTCVVYHPENPLLSGKISTLSVFPQSVIYNV